VGSVEESAASRLKERANRVVCDSGAGVDGHGNHYWSQMDHELGA
jgi:hypothetical protein